MNIIKRIGLYDIVQSMHKFNIIYIGVGTGGGGGGGGGHLPSLTLRWGGIVPPKELYIFIFQIIKKSDK